MDARELRCFVAVAEDLHFGRAARRLSLTASALSKAVSRLEASTGVQLFDRDTHRVALTDAGLTLLEYARDAVVGLDQAIAAAQEAGRHQMTGTLNVGVSPFLRYHLAPALIGRFASTHPCVVVNHREELSGPLVEELQHRKLDVGLCFCPARHEDLIYRWIGSAELVVLVARQHPLAARTSVSLFELRDETFLTPSRAAAPAWCERFAALFAKAGFEPQIAPQTIDYDEELTAVGSGTGVALTSRFFHDSLPAEIAEIDLDPQPEMPFELVRRAEPPSPSLARFIESVNDAPRGLPAYHEH